MPEIASPNSNTNRDSTIHNTTYHNAWNSGYNGSGISLWTAQCIEAGALNCFTSGVAGAPSSDWNYTPSGNDTATFNGVGAWTPFHNVISWNVSYNNRITALSGLACNAHTDGNGIIMDTFFDHFAYTLPYQYQTLVMNNVAYYNGGRGLHTVNGRLVTFANNTAFNNGTDGCETKSQWVAGDLDNAGNSNTWINNLALTVQSVGWLGAAPTGPNNCSLIPDDNGSVTGVTFNNNILSTPESANVVAPLVHACLNTNATNFFNCTNNKCSTDPGFVNATAGAASDSAGNPVGGTWQPGNDNLALTATSPAIGYVQSPPPSWLPAQNVDAGACHHSLTTCPNPGRRITRAASMIRRWFLALRCWMLHEKYRLKCNAATPARCRRRAPGKEVSCMRRSRRHGKKTCFLSLFRSSLSPLPHPRFLAPNVSSRVSAFCREVAQAVPVA